MIHECDELGGAGGWMVYVCCKIKSLENIGNKGELKLQAVMNGPSQSAHVGACCRQRLLLSRLPAQHLPFQFFLWFGGLFLQLVLKNV